MHIYAIMNNLIKDKYPTIARVLCGTAFDDDLNKAHVIVTSEMTSQNQKSAIRDSSIFQCGELSSSLAYYTYFGGGSLQVQELEAGLQFLVDSLGLNTVQRVFRDKLLIGNKSAFEDTVYEIVIAAKAGKFLDEGTLELEKSIPQSRKNSDVFGKFKENSVRIETTVLHEDPPTSIDCAWMDLVKSADFPSGFRVNFRKALSSELLAEQVKRDIEELYRGHHSGGEVDIQVGDVTFQWDRGVYRSLSSDSIIEMVHLDLPMTVRWLVNPCRTQRVTPRYIEEDTPNPEGVISVMPIGENHNDNTLSSKVFQIVQRKLSQCEDGIVNILALGNPSSENAREIYDALTGPIIVIASNMDVQCHRHPKGPFCPKDRMTVEDYEQFAKAFEKLSAILLFGFSSEIESTLFLNPNANVPLSADLISEINDALAGAGISQEVLRDLFPKDAL